MQSTDGERLREQTGAALKSAMPGSAGLVALVLLFLASMSYVALGGTLALEASPIPDAEMSIAGAAVVAANAGGDRNVMTYEDD